MSDQEDKAKIEQELFDKVKDTKLFADALNNHGKQYFEQHKVDAIKKAQGETYGMFDSIAEEVLGLKKEQGEKSSEIWRKALSELKTLRESKGASSEDVTAALEAQKKQFDLDMAKAQAALSDKDKMLIELQTKTERTEIDALFAKEFTGKIFNPSLTKQVLDDSLELRNMRNLGTAKIEDGKIVFFNPDGTKRTNNKGLAMSAKEVVDADYADLFETKTKGGDANDDKSYLEGDKVVVNMNTVKNRVQFNEEFAKLMANAGIASHEEKYNEKLKEAMQEYGYDKLPYK